MRVCVLAVLVLVTTGCADAGPFACKTTADCAAAAAGGTCEASGYCSFPDDECASGRRYGSHAPSDIAGTCVPPEVADDTSATDPTGLDDDVGDDGIDVTTMSGDTMNAGDTTSALDGSSSEGAASSDSASSLTVTTLDGSATDTSSGGGGSSTTGDEPFEVEYPAVIAVCTQDTVFDPTQCAAQAGVDQFTVDGSDGSDLVAHGWLRFDLDDTLADAEVTSAALVFTVGPDASDGSVDPGELWTTAPFDLADLSLGNPMTLDLVGEDFGAILLGVEVSWPVPTELVIAGESLHLALVPTGTDGLDIWDATSATPPRLVVTAE